MPIIKLPEDVIIKISAGEVITSYYDILKELLENSLDAQATEIEIKIPEKKNSPEVIEIRDNGIGIEKDDFNLLCTRHCTSKFKSLDEIDFFGFRGEALASIALIADVIVESYAQFTSLKFVDDKKFFTDDLDDLKLSSKNENNEPYGYIAKYKTGKLVSLKPKAMKKGTFIRITNIHKDWNLKMDKKECIMLIVNYQINNPNVKIMMNGMGDTYLNMLNPFNRSKIIDYFYKTGDLIVYEDDSYSFASSYSLKKFTLVLFVNGRLVSNTKLRNEIIRIYKKYFPLKKFPFVYLSLKITNVDVNVHPRKKEVLIDQLPDLEFIEELLDNKRGIKKLKCDNTGMIKNIRKVYTDPNASTIEESILSSINEKNFNNEIKLKSIKNQKWENISVDTQNIDKTINYDLESINDENGIFHYYNLKSLKNLRLKQMIVDKLFFRGLVFIGTCEGTLFVQKDSLLLECKEKKLLNVFLYQKILFNFGNYKTIQYNKLSLVQNNRCKDGHSSEKTQLNCKNIRLIHDILREYFKIDLKSLVFPTIYNLKPKFEKWDEFIFKVESIEWIDEEELFEKIMRLMADVFIDFNLKDNFRLLKNDIMGSREALECFMVVSSLGELFKHFERC
ncbi:DNA mismatch repair protein Mlh1 [Dictyocoela muelleri]|nr:DNA mismatch repair protein Mlh1 [Dictyocoela muelleri]